MTTRVRWLLTALVAGAVFAPAVLPDASDGFPISTYPMFTYERGRVMALDTVVVVDGDERHRLSPEAISGTDEAVLASARVSDAIRAGGAARLCREVAARVDEPGEVQVVTEVHDTVELVRDGADPRSTTVHARCPAGADR